MVVITNTDWIVLNLRSSSIEIRAFGHNCLTLDWPQPFFLLFMSMYMTSCELRPVVWRVDCVLAVRWRICHAVTLLTCGNCLIVYKCMRLCACAMRMTNEKRQRQRQYKKIEQSWKNTKHILQVFICMFKLFFVILLNQILHTSYKWQNIGWLVFQNYPIIIRSL